MMDLNRKYIRNQDNVAETEFEGATVLLDIESCKYLKLNLTAKDLWTWSQTAITIANLVTKLVDKYQIDHQLAHKDVISWLESMLDRKLVIAVE